MRNIYLFLILVLTSFLIIPKIAVGQSCSITATFKTYESRCAATGSIKVFSGGGSGSYKYKTFGPVNSNFTTSDSLTGLSAGVYSVLITDIVSNCSYTQSGLVVPGSYQDPRFGLNKTDVSCDGVNNGSIQAQGQQFGRSPFLFTIVAPSPMGVGTVDSNGVFNNLSAGNYSIRLTDSCGGIQTRNITVNGYSWWIDSYNFNKISCDSASGFIKVVDSRGNISTIGGIPGFHYGIVRSQGDTVWSLNPNFQFALLGQTHFTVVAEDSCGDIKSAPAQIIIQPSVNGVIITSQSCTSFTATVSGVTNYYTAGFCLYDSANNQLSCNTTGIFTNLTYGNYCIKIHDNCTDTTIIRCFTNAHPPLGIINSVLIANKTCAVFSASITGQYGLTNPNYCLYDSTNTKVVCNSTGVFNNLIYSRYCIKVTDGCRDTTISTCFATVRPVPIVPTSFTPHYITCNTFGITVGGDSLTRPSYCLYDSTNSLIGCNSTGNFDSLSIGRFCVHVYDSCYDTTFVRCFSAGSKTITNDMSLNASNKACKNFTLTINTNNIKNALFCLYNASDSSIACDSTGIFNNIPYGSYCVKAKNDCPDTSFFTCITVNANMPSVDNSVQFLKYTCSTFSAQITGQQNLNSPIYCLSDSNGVQIICNSNGRFDSLAYGKYCIKIKDSCNDTTIVRCFTSLPLPAHISVTSNKSCSYNFAKFTVSVLSGVLPVNLKIYTYTHSVLFSGNYNSNQFSVDSIPGTVTGQNYTVIVTDSCGKQDSVNLGATASFLSHSISAKGKCPSGTYPNGSGDIISTASTNMGYLSVKIVSHNGTVLSPSVSPDIVLGGVYTFQDLAPGSYMVKYKASDGCNIFYQDTVVIQPYHFPDLSRSSAYQCDSDGFNLKAIISNGVGPFSFEIIGSSPTAPSIISAPQASPDFSINNGTNYTLVRLRALDACGNAALADASVLPLANNAIVNTYNCYQVATTLRMDTVYNANFAWYKKAQYSSTDSLYLSSASSIYIPFVTYADTGIYVCHFILGTGCINRTYNYHLDGSCNQVLPIYLQHFNGNFVAKHILLSWQLAIIPSAKYVEIEKNSGDGNFKEIGSVKITAATPLQQYLFTDTRPAFKNFYRLKWKDNDGTFTYSNIVEVSRTTESGGVRIYPNPANDIINISFINPKNDLFNITILNLLNQPLRELKNLSDLNVIQISSSGQLKRGLYVIKMTNLNTQETFTQKVIFR